MLYNLVYLIIKVKPTASMAAKIATWPKRIHLNCDLENRLLSQSYSYVHELHNPGEKALKRMT